MLEYGKCQGRQREKGKEGMFESAKLMSIALNRGIDTYISVL